MMTDGLMRQGLRVALSVACLLASPVYWMIILVVVVDWMSGDCDHDPERFCPTTETEAKFYSLLLLIGGTVLFGLAGFFWRRLDNHLMTGRRGEGSMRDRSMLLGSDANLQGMRAEITKDWRRRRRLQLALSVSCLIAATIYWLIVVMAVLAWTTADCYTVDGPCPSEANNAFYAISILIGGTLLFGLAVLAWRRLSNHLAVDRTS